MLRILKKIQKTLTNYTNQKYEICKFHFIIIYVMETRFDIDYIYIFI